MVAARNGDHTQVPQSSQRSGGFHKPAVSGAAPETAIIFASTQQPVGFLCKQALSGQHRLEAPFYAARSAANERHCNSFISRLAAR